MKPCANCFKLITGDIYMANDLYFCSESCRNIILENNIKQKKLKNRCYSFTNDWFFAFRRYSMNFSKFF